MLGKLLKYDLKWTIKIIYIFLGLGFIFAVSGRVIDQLFDSFFFDIVVKICYGTGVALSVNALVNGGIRCWSRFIANLYKDESYLTNTLPVKRSTHFISKNLNALIIILTCFVVLVLNLFIMYYSKENMEAIKTFFTSVATTIDIPLPLFIGLLIVLLFVEIFYFIELGFFGIVFGYSHNNKKFLFSLLYASIGFVIGTIINFIILLVISFFNKDLYNLLFASAMNNTQILIEFDLLKGIMILCICLYTVYIGILFIIANAKLKKGVNID